MNQRILFLTSFACCLFALTCLLRAQDSGEKSDRTPQVKAPTPKKAQAPTVKPRKVRSSRTVRPVARSKRPPLDGTYSLPLPPESFTPPSLAVESPVYEWDSVMRGSLVKHTFQIKNTGGLPLVIERVKPSCGCTTVDQPSKPIPPGGSDTVTLQIDTKRFKSTIRKTAKVYSNAENSPHELVMTGNVEEIFVSEPSRPRLEVVRGSTPKPLKITFRKKTSLPAKIVGVDTKSRVITAELNEVTPGEVYEVVINAELNESKRSYYYESLNVKVEGDGKTFDIPTRITIVLKQRIEITPRSVYFSAKQTEKLTGENPEPLVKVLDIKGLGGADQSFKVTDVKNSGTGFETKLTTVTEGKHYRLTVSLKSRPENVGRTLRNMITVTTDDESVKELKVTAMAIFRTSGSTRARARTSPGIRQRTPIRKAPTPPVKKTN